MSNVLHVLNGDATLNVFERTGIEGATMVWREVLSEGPLYGNIEDAAFWKQRADFICRAFGENAEGYATKVLAELEKFNEPYQEINLWFEFDLHCQVNLLGALMFLSQNVDLSGPAVYLICPAGVDGVDDFRGMGQLTGEQLEQVYDEVRVQLAAYDFKLAAEAGSLYVAADADKLEAWLNQTMFWGNMQCLKPALQAHIGRLRKNADGLNEIEQTLLDIYQKGITQRSQIYTVFWAGNKIYGMGDSEIDNYLNGLSARGLIYI